MCPVALHTFPPAARNGGQSRATLWTPSSFACRLLDINLRFCLDSPKILGHGTRYSSQQLCATTTLNSVIRVRCPLRHLVAPVCGLPLLHSALRYTIPWSDGNTCWINYESECPRSLDEFRRRFPGLTMCGAYQWVTSCCPIAISLALRLATTVNDRSGTMAYDTWSN